MGEAGQAAPVQRDPVVALDRRADHPRRAGRDVEGRGEVVDRRRRRAARVDGALAVEVVQHRLGRRGRGSRTRSRRTATRDSCGGMTLSVGRRRGEPAQPVAVAVVTRRVDELRAGVRGDHPLRRGRVDDVELVDGRRDAGGVGELQVVGDVVLAVGAEEGERRRAQRPHDDRGERVGDLDQLRVVDRVAGRGGAHRRAGRGAEREGRQHGDASGAGPMAGRSSGRRPAWGRSASAGRSPWWCLHPVVEWCGHHRSGHVRVRRFTPDHRSGRRRLRREADRPTWSPRRWRRASRSGCSGDGALTGE